MKVFQGGSLQEKVGALQEVEDTLATARGEFVVACFEAVGDSPAESRRTLLGLKRRAYNGKSIGHRLEGDDAIELPTSVRRAAKPVVRLEGEFLRRHRELEETFRLQLRAEADALSLALDQPAFLRALALSSKPLAQQLDSVRKALAKGSGRKERRARYSLARYLSRAAYKLSPFSTFTRWALVNAETGEGEECAASRGIHLCGLPAAWEDLSLVRIRRYLIEQIEAAWRQSPALRPTLRVEVNPTLRGTGEDTYQLLTPLRWIARKAEGAAWFRSIGGLPSEASVDSSVVAWLRTVVDPVIELGALEDRFAAQLEGDDRAARSQRIVSRLLRQGVLVATSPWPRTEARLEETLWRWFEGEPEMPEAADSLAPLVALERGFAEASDPVASVEKIDLALDGAWAAARNAAEIPADATLHRFKEAEIYEDVVVALGGGKERIVADPEVLSDLLRQAAPWHRLLDAFSLRHDILLTAAAIVERHWPKRRRGSALEVFAEMAPMWPAAREIFRNPLSLYRGQLSFNPLDLPEVHRLHEIRRDLWARLRSLLDNRVQEEPGEVRVSGLQIAALLEDLPAGSEPPLGPCLFVQPEASGSDRWVVHRVFEGTGRYPGRVIPPLPEEDRKGLLSALIDASGPASKGNRCTELVDLYSSRGDTLNVHEVRTRRALWLPGEAPPVDAGRAIPLDEVEISLDGPRPILVDGQGAPILPLHLGAATLAFMPAMIAFLAQFGAGEIHSTIPPQPSREIAGVTHFDRVVLDRLVLARRRWKLPPDLLTPELESGDSAAYSALRSWCREHEIPDRVFAIERVHFGEASTFKPQFLDLRSPTFCELFVGMLREAREPLVLEEMLPKPEGFPGDHAGERWAAELIVDSSCFERSDDQPATGLR